MRAVLETHSVRRTSRLIRGRRLLCLLSLCWVFSLPPPDAARSRDVARRPPQPRGKIACCQTAPTALGASGRRRPGAGRTQTPRPSPYADPWRAPANAGALCSARNSTFRPALRCALADDPVPQSGRPPPPLAPDGRPVIVACARAGAQVPLFSCRHDRMGTDVPHPCGSTNPTRIQGHLDALFCDCR